MQRFYIANIDDAASCRVETQLGTIRLKAKFSASLHPRVVCAPYGWWQACPSLELPAYNALSPAGANLNLIITNTNADPISASVPHRSTMCRLSKHTELRVARDAE
jgi:anaerobic selenocysteine-containing dehydrogenase